MITFLHGHLTSALPTQAIVDVGGVGYEVFIPLSSYDKLPAAGESVRILTHLHVREDAQILYGFMTAAERDLFRLLVNHVSGIGPKLALAVLSGMSDRENDQWTILDSMVGPGRRLSDVEAEQLRITLAQAAESNRLMRRTSSRLRELVKGTGLVEPPESAEAVKRAVLAKPDAAICRPMPASPSTAGGRAHD